ncbi:hypothetical protein Mal15_55270 [Stieleria maiorica]|uniref:Uncharacterized protein n=1 Tax=Stieleria maiorica TaxID=2795974 RepID=A0A5B9MN28_9BACT|nr:hypothetical protein Mal15_55270 [Stieleria maiorica]
MGASPGCVAAEPAASAVRLIKSTNPDRGVIGIRPPNIRIRTQVGREMKRTDANNRQILPNSHDRKDLNGR